MKPMGDWTGATQRPRNRSCGLGAAFELPPESTRAAADMSDLPQFVVAYVRGAWRPARVTGLNRQTVDVVHQHSSHAQRVLLDRVRVPVTHADAYRWALAYFKSVGHEVEVARLEKLGEAGWTP